MQTCPHCCLCCAHDATANTVKKKQLANTYVNNLVADMHSVSAPVFRTHAARLYFLQFSVSATCDSRSVAHPEFIE